MQNLLKYCAAAALLLCGADIWAQTGSISGVVIDDKSREGVVGANIRLLRQSDTTAQIGGLSSDIDGRFKFEQLAADTYQLRISYVGYENMIVQNLRLANNSSYPLDTVRMKESSDFFDDIVVEAVAIRVEVINDTIQYNASAFKVNPDATVEDLVKKMPGITVENGTIKAQGEEVKKVTIDGKEFFGNDANTALKNLPAEVVDKIQVFDRASDQSALSGISDGQEMKALNIKTKSGNLKGNFGRFYAGYGTDNRYSAGGNFNSFQGSRRLSILGMSNNINMQNFGSEDMLGVMTSQMGGGGGGGRGGGWRPNTNESFFTGQQNGISTTHAFGINYADKWGKKMEVSASYFFNYIDNSNLTAINRQYLTPSEGGLSQLYDETTNSGNTNLNHRANLRLEYKPDSMTTLIFAPRASWQDNSAINNFFGINQLSNNQFLNSTNSQTNTDGGAFNLSGNATYSRNFKKPMRNLTIDLTGSSNNQLSQRQQLSENLYVENIDSALLLDQFTKNYSRNSNGNLDISYNEPIGKQGVLSFNYNEGITYATSDKTTRDFDPATNDYNQIDTTLSNDLASIYQTHRPGVRYRYRQGRGAKMNLMFGVNYQYATLLSEQTFPAQPDISRSFNSVLPIAMFRYQFSKTSGIRMFYRTYTSAPTAKQLQNAVDNSNVLLLSAGNPELEQSYSHFLTARYNWTNPKNAHSFFLNFSATLTDKYIGTSTLVAQNDTTLAGGVVLYKGAQLSQNVNLNGYSSVNGNLTYSLPLTPIKCNFTVNVGANYNILPSQINGENNFTRSFGVPMGVFISSNINENIDFTVSYNLTYNTARNQLRPELNTNYLYHNALARANWIFAKNFVLSASGSYMAYTGLADGFNQQYFLLSGKFGYKFLKNRQAEINISVFDALNQNQSISRTVSDIYIQDQSTQVLTRYVMLNFVYTLRTITPPKPNGDRPDGPPRGDRPQGPPPHGMMPPH